MKIFEVWGELTLKDTLTQDLAAAQAKVNQFATGIQNTLGYVKPTLSTSEIDKFVKSQRALYDSVIQMQSSLTLPFDKYDRQVDNINKRIAVLKSNIASVFDAQINAASKSGASMQQLTSIYNTYLNSLKQADILAQNQINMINRNRGMGELSLGVAKEKETQKIIDARNKELDNLASYNAQKENQIQKSISTNNKEVNALKAANDSISKQMDEMWAKREADIRRQKEQDFKRFESATIQSRPKETDSDVAYRKAMSENDSFLKSREDLTDKIIKLQKKQADELKKYTLDVQAQFDKVRGASQKAAEASTEHWDKFNRSFGRLQRTLQAWVGMWIIFQTKDLVVFPVKEAIRFNEELEKVKLGIASLLTAQGQFKNLAGDSATGITALNAALKLSDNIIQKLKVDNLSTMATFEQLAKAYQSALSPGLSVGFDLDQIRQYSVAMVQAASAMGMPLDMMAEELRSMLKGTITPRNTIIATNLGITPEQIKEYRFYSEGLFKFVMEKLSAFNEAGVKSQDTWAGLMSNVKDSFSMIFGEAGGKFFEYFKGQLREIQRYLVQVDKVTGEIKLNPEVVSAMEKFYALVKALYQMVSVPVEIAVKISVAGSNALDDIIRKAEQVQTIINNFSYGDMFKYLQTTPTDQTSKPFGWIEEFLNITNQRTYETTNALDKQADSTIKASKAYDELWFSGNRISKSTKEMREDLKNLINATKEADKEFESLAKTLNNQAISAVEEYNATVMGMDPKYISIMKQYKKDLEEINNLRKKLGSESDGVYSQKEIEVMLQKQKYLAEYTLKTNLNTWKVEQERKKALEAIEYIQIKINSLQDNYNKMLDRSKEQQDRIKTAVENRKNMQQELADLESAQQQASQIQTEIMLAQNRMRAAFTPEGKEEWAAYIDELVQMFNEVNPGEGSLAYMQELRSQISNESEFIRQSTDASIQYARQAMDSYNSKLYSMIDEWTRKISVEQGDKLDLRTVQQGISEFLKEQSSIEDKIYKTEQERADLWRYMNENNLNGDEWQSALTALNNYDTALLELKFQLDTINGFLNELEIQKNINLGVDPTNTYEELNNINDAINNFRDLISQPFSIDLDTSAAVSKIQSLQSMLQSVTSGLSGGTTGPLSGFSFEAPSFESDWTINALLAQSPALPFTEGYNKLLGRLNSLPKGSTFQIDVLMNKAGMSANEALNFAQQNQNLNSLYAQLKEAQNLAYYYEHQAYNGLSFGMPAMVSHYTDVVIPMLQDAIQQAQMSNYALYAGSSGNTSKNTVTGVDSSSINESGVSVQVGSIIINLTGADRNSAITLADRIDEELARKIKSSDSKVAAALKRGGLS